MRRLRDRRPNTFFRGGELARLLSMVAMLVVLGMMIARARDPMLWRWLAPGDEAAVTDGVAVALVEPPEVRATEKVAAGPTDRDAEELDAAREEFQAVTDQAPLSKEEMAAYWRLMGWQQHQSVDEMLKRSTADVSFRQIFEQPQKWRGRLVRIPLHLRQTAAVDDLADNPLGLKRLDEVWGWTTDSQPYSYWLVCSQLPPGMPRGKNIYAEATFVGYFLKLIPYEDHEGVKRSTPLLIGKLIWHPSPDVRANTEEWTWPWLAAAGVLVLFVIRWVVWFGRRSSSPITASRPVDPEAVEEWLEQADDGRAANSGGHDPEGGTRPDDGQRGGWTPHDL